MKYLLEYLVLQDLDMEMSYRIALVVVRRFRDRYSPQTF